MQQQASISIEGLSKTFVLHNQQRASIPVFDDLALKVFPGECVVLDGPSGIGKSSLMRAIYANYHVSAGKVLLRHGEELIDLAAADPWTIMEARRLTLGYVGQFLRVIPRIAAIDIVMEPMLANGWERSAALARAKELLSRLNVPEGLWKLPPATFSGGEQQRVNVARGFALRYPVLLLDEPTASLDAENRDVVVCLIREALGEGAAIVGIFHDGEVCARVATRKFSLGAYAPKNGKKVATV